MKLLKKTAATLVFLCAGATTAIACEKPVALEPAQIRELMTLIKNPEGDELEQIFGFETLMCAKRPAVRDLATRTALESPNETLKASIMFELLFAKEQLLVEYIVEEGQSSEYYEFVKQQPTLSFIVAKRSREANCLAIKAHNGAGDCASEGAWNLVEASGTRVNLILGDSYRATFELEGKELVGAMSGEKIAFNRQSLGDVPVRLRLID